MALLFERREEDKGSRQKEQQMDTPLDTGLKNSHRGRIELENGNNDKPGTNGLVLPAIEMFHETSPRVRGRAQINAAPVHGLQLSVHG